ncbi:MAG TPA: protein-L-isoaspartate(D-aspartate) O-methyltransferase [Planctomycetes bacterium]|nr:protein-L-isoaspartate(D-aspartate) O-methyltransferase [Planctomycetota bacterium]
MEKAGERNGSNPGKEKGSGARGPDPYLQERFRMVETQIRARGIRDPRVLEAMVRVPRERFLPTEFRDLAFKDSPISIGSGQTISQPYIVALMTELLQLTGKERVLEVGTGSGYQCAILAELAKEVFTVEIVPELASRARKILENLGYRNIHYRIGSGFEPWPGEAPFDRIILTAAPPSLPQSLLEQCKIGGRIVAPVGVGQQWLMVYDRLKDGSFRRTKVIPVRFVPMVPETRP